MGLALFDGDAGFDREPVGYVRNVQRHDVDAAQAGIDGQGEHGNIPDIAELGEEGTDRRHLLGGKRRFSPDDLPLVPCFFRCGHGPDFTPAKTP